MKVQIDGITQEMFGNYTVHDDIAMLENLLSQIVDHAGETDATAYDESEDCDWGANDVLEYLRTKYKNYIENGTLKCPKEW